VIAAPGNPKEMQGTTPCLPDNDIAPCGEEKGCTAPRNARGDARRRLLPAPLSEGVGGEPWSVHPSDPARLATNQTALLVVEERSSARAEHTQTNERRAVGGGFHVDDAGVDCRELGRGRLA